MSAVRREAQDEAFTLNPAATTLTIIDALSAELRNLDSLCMALFHSESDTPRGEFWALVRRINAVQQLAAELGERAMRGERQKS